MARLRILHVIDRLDRRLGGSVAATLGICKFLKLAQVDVEACGSIGPDDVLDHLDTEFGDFPIHRFARSFPRRYAGSIQFYRWLDQAIAKYDLIEIHAIFSAFTLQAGKICRNHRKPYIIRPHGSLDPFDLRKHALLKRLVGPVLVRPLLAGANLLLATAALESERLVLYGATVEKAVIPLPILLDDEHGSRNSFRNRHNIPLDAQVVLFLSRLDYKKGLEFLIPALARLKQKFPRLWFVLAGSGDPAYVKKTEQVLAEFNTSEFTRRIGFVTGQEKRDAFAAADIFALPSLNENFGIVNIEAMQAGLPLLISDQVYICREIEAAGSGIICSPSVNSVAEKMEEMLSGATDLKLMGQRGHGLVQRCYRPEVATQSLIEVYRKILGHSYNLG
jgi:glycosyltransferase involved in cell wall biosynthesis